MSDNSGTNADVNQTIAGTALGQLVFVPVNGGGYISASGSIATALPKDLFSTITISTDETAVDDEALPRAWRAILGFEGYPTDDSGRKRFIIRGALTERQMPLPFSVQFAEAEGHMGKQTAGRIDSIERIPASEFAVEGFTLPDDLPEDAIIVFGTGIWDLEGEAGREAARLVAGKFMRGVSFDLVDTTWVPVDPESLEEIDPETLSLEEMMTGNFYAGAKSAQIAGATIVSESAFGDAMVASAVLFFSSQIVNVYDADVLVACAAGPLKPPSSFFSRLRFRKKTPIAVTEEGEFSGHIATWDCHMGNDESCFRAPRGLDYSSFHTGTIVTEEGEHVKVGRITVAKHALYGATRDEVIAHYSDPKKVGAFVVIWEDEFGLACHGVTRSDAPPELLRDLYANPPSPDWRRRELLGVSTVPLPGLPVVDPQAVMVASADGIPEVDVLILPPLEPEDFVDSKTEGDVLVAAAILQGDDALLDLIAGE